MRIDFYVSPSNQPQARLVLACRLARKAWQANKPCWLRCADPEQQQALDELLWSWRDDFFMPHNKAQENPNAPIVLAVDDLPAQDDTILINLHLDAVEQSLLKQPTLSRIIEIVCQDEEILLKSRQNFVYYRKLGYQPQRVEL